MEGKERYEEKGGTYIFDQPLLCKRKWEWTYGMQISENKTGKAESQAKMKSRNERRKRKCRGVEKYLLNKQYSRTEIK